MRMNMLDFTAEETSLIAIYANDTREATLANMTAALPDMDSTMRDIARLLRQRSNDSTKTGTR
jgi:predicted MarR family transcription regulator